MAYTVTSETKIQGLSKAEIHELIETAIIEHGLPKSWYFWIGCELHLLLDSGHVVHKLPARIYKPKVRAAVEEIKQAGASYRAARAAK